MTNLIIIGYDAIAFFGVFTVVYVMVKTGHDKINKVAPVWLSEIRRAFLASTALLLLYSIADEASYRSLVLIFGSGIINFAINAVALHLRSNHPGGSSSGEEAIWRERQPSTQFGHYISRADVERLDNGQHYTHELLEAILRNQELEPDAAVIDPNTAIVYPPQFHPRQ
jgi:hypothetical protein